MNVVRAIVSAVETRDQYTRGHSERVALFGKRLAREMGYDEENCERIYLTCLLHDVGKIGISDATLRKTGRLTAEEYEEIKRHPDLGWAILHDLEQLGHLFPGIVHHHERYDGDGYPDGLAGEEVPLDARIVAVVDAYDAMTSDRPYRKGLSQEQTESILREGMGRQWDADVVTAFLRIMPEILRLRKPTAAPCRRDDRRTLPHRRTACRYSGNSRRADSLRTWGRFPNLPERRQVGKPAPRCPAIPETDLVSVEVGSDLRDPSRETLGQLLPALVRRFADCGRCGGVGRTTAGSSWPSAVPSSRSISADTRAISSRVKTPLRTHASTSV